MLDLTEFFLSVGPFPDPDLMAAGAKLCKVQPQPLISLVLDGLSEIELTPSKFGPVPRGTPIISLSTLNMQWPYLAQLAP